MTDSTQQTANISINEIIDALRNTGIQENDLVKTDVESMRIGRFWRKIIAAILRAIADTLDPRDG